MAVFDLVKKRCTKRKGAGKIALETLHLSTIFCNFGNRVSKMELRSCIFAWQKQRLITCEATHHLTVISIHRARELARTHRRNLAAAHNLHMHISITVQSMYPNKKYSISQTDYSNSILIAPLCFLR